MALSRSARDDSNLFGGTVPCTVQRRRRWRAHERARSSPSTGADRRERRFPARTRERTDRRFPIITASSCGAATKISLTSAGCGVARRRIRRLLQTTAAGATPWRHRPQRLFRRLRQGYNHMMDTRSEVRDAQRFRGAGRPARDGGVASEGLLRMRRPGAIGGRADLTGAEYPTALGRSRRKMLGGGRCRRKAPRAWSERRRQTAAHRGRAARIPWTDSPPPPAPKRHSLDYVARPYFLRARVGVMKQLGHRPLRDRVASKYGCPETTRRRTSPHVRGHNAGEPYDRTRSPSTFVESDAAQRPTNRRLDAPAPMLISNGLTDDLFPPDRRSLRNRTRTNHPYASVVFAATATCRAEQGPDAVFRNRAQHPGSIHLRSTAHSVPRRPDLTPGGADLVGGRVDSTNRNRPAVTAATAALAPARCASRAPLADDPVRRTDRCPISRVRPPRRGGACATTSGR